MTRHLTRRGFLSRSAAVGAAGAAATLSRARATRAGETLAGEKVAGEKVAGRPPLRIGLMSYNLARDWDVQTILDNCTATKFEHVELRTTHAHGVEVTLSKQERQEVRKRFEDAGVKISLASGFAYHWPDAEQLRQNIEGTKEYTLLAADLGALGIRVFANALLADKGIPEEQTIAQIGKAVSEVADFAADHGVEIRLANHGRGTNRVSVVRKILDHADSPHVWVNWNCDKTDVEAPGFEAHFKMVKNRIRNIHLHDLSDENYPYRKLFTLLRRSGYPGYCDAEVSASQEPLTFMRYYRALFLALQNVI